MSRILPGGQESQFLVPRLNIELAGQLKHIFWSGRTKGLAMGQGVKLVFKVLALR